jgi:two-component system sensor histidine kinase TrcS
MKYAGENAATGNEKKIRVRTGTVRVKGKKYAEVSISNTGDGIFPEDLPHIFERFYRADKSRSTGGYGLGLSIAKAIVEHAGGAISAKSAGGLTTFTIHIPT